MMGMKAISEIISFDNLSNSFSSTDIVGSVKILYFHIYNVNKAVGGF